MALSLFSPFSWLRSGGAAMLLLATVCSGGTTLGPIDAPALLAKVDQAMGASRLKTVSYSGSGTGSLYGQAFGPGTPWPTLNYSAFARTIDYENAAMSEVFARSRGEPKGGGATPLMGQGEARGSAFLRGNHAWNAAGSTAFPAPKEVDARIAALWTTAHGIVKAAQRVGASAEITARRGGTFTTFTVTEPGRYTATAWLDTQNRVQRIESRIANPVVGDVEVTTTYDDYRDLGGGIQFPYRMTQTIGPYPILEIAFSEVKANPPVDIALPENVRTHAGERVVSDKVADGVWHLTGGSHHSVVIEMADHLVVVETPLDDSRAVAVLAEARRLVPGKPVRYVIASHHHHDHAGGLRAAAAEGVTLVTSELARQSFGRAFENPGRISPDLLARSGRKPTFVGVSMKHVLSDGHRQIEIHQILQSLHAEGFLMVWLPKERLLIEADAYTPGAPPPAVPNANHVNLVWNIERLGLDVDRILPLHGRIAPYTELLAAIGRR